MESVYCFQCGKIGESNSQNETVNIHIRHLREKHIKRYDEKTGKEIK